MIIIIIIIATAIMIVTRIAAHIIALIRNIGVVTLSVLVASHANNNNHSNTGKCTQNHVVRIIIRISIILVLIVVVMITVITK